MGTDDDHLRELDRWVTEAIDGLTEAMGLVTRLKATVDSRVATRNRFVKLLQSTPDTEPKAEVKD